MSTLDTAEQERSPRTAAEWLWPLLPIGVAVFCVSSLLYFHANHGVMNPSSALQRMIAGIYRVFGLAPAVMFFVLVVAWSTIWFATGKLDRPLVRISRLLAMAVMLGVFLNLGDGGVTAAVHKGELGAWLAGTLVARIGYFPSLVLVWLITFASLLLATDFFFSDSFERLRARPAATETGVESAVTDHLRGLQTAMHGANAAAARASVPPLVLDEPRSTAPDAVMEPLAVADDPAPDDFAVTNDPPAAEAGGESRTPWDGEPAGLPDVVEPRAAAAADDLAGLADAIGTDDAAAEPVVSIPRPDTSPRLPVVPSPDEAPAAAPNAEPSVRQQNLFAASGADEELVEEAVELIAGSRRVTATLLQRRLRIDYAQALEVLAQLAARGKIELEADASQGRVLV